MLLNSFTNTALHKFSKFSKKTQFFSFKFTTILTISIYFKTLIFTHKKIFYHSNLHIKLIIYLLQKSHSNSSPTTSL